MEECNNCGALIGKLETHHLWREQIVCASCHQKLSAHAAAIALSSDMGNRGHFIALKCESCGGKLDVFDDMERFACSYCGAEMVVQRRGGTVVLKQITAAIKEVQVGTDKTAAELAIVRHEKELSELEGLKEKLDGQISNVGCGIGCFGFLALIGLIGLASDLPSGFGWGITAVGGFCILGLIANIKTLSRNRMSIERTILDKQQQVVAKKRIVDG